MTKSELLENMQIGYTKVTEALAGVRDSAANSPRAIGEWSIKDMVAHLLVWEEEASHRLELISAGREHEITYIDEDVLDAWNAKAVEAKRSLSWQQTLAAFAAARKRLLEALEEISEERFAADTEPVPIYRWLPNSTYTHDEAHLPEIVAWLAKKS